MKTYIYCLFTLKDPMTLSDTAGVIVFSGIVVYILPCNDYIFKALKNVSWLFRSYAVRKTPSLFV